MINYHNTLVNALNTILPTRYEMTIDKNTPIPCITWMELNNASTANGNTLGYSRLSYQIKVWGNKIEDLQYYAQEIDKVMRFMGWTRISSGELYDNQSTMMQKIMTYEALAYEHFN